MWLFVSISQIYIKQGLRVLSYSSFLNKFIYIYHFLTKHFCSLFRTSGTRAFKCSILLDRSASFLLSGHPPSTWRFQKNCSSAAFKSWKCTISENWISLCCIFFPINFKTLPTIWKLSSITDTYEASTMYVLSRIFLKFYSSEAEIKPKHDCKILTNVPTLFLSLCCRHFKFTPRLDLGQLQLCNHWHFSRSRNWQLS